MSTLFQLPAPTRLKVKVEDTLRIGFLFQNKCSVTITRCGSENWFKHKAYDLAESNVKANVNSKLSLSHNLHGNAFATICSKKIS